jgi:dimethylglycine dehydrogenase
MEAVGRECLNVRDHVGSVDLSAFSKFEISGRGAADFMASLGSNKPPARDGRIGLTHVLTSRGGVASEFTITRLAEDRFYLTSAAFAERHDEDMLRSRAGDGVTITNLTERRGILGVMGPKARDLLQTVCDDDLSNTAFPWLSAREITVAGIPVLALRVSYVGELGWELHADLDRFGDLYRAVSEAGKPFHHAPFGIYAVNAMRLEKGYRGWGADLTTERTPLESGLEALVRTEGRSFIGREAMLDRAASGKAWRMALFCVEDDGVSLPFYNHTVWQEGRAVGVVTSGGYGFRTGMPLVLAYLTPQATSAPMSICVIDRDLAITELREAPYDPENLKPRGIVAAIQQIKKVG